MSTSKLAVTISGVMLILTVTLAVREVQSGREIATAVAAANEEQGVRQAMLGGLMNRADRIEQERGILQQRLIDARTAKAAADQRATQSVATVAASAPDPVATGQAFMAAHQEVKGAFAERSRALIMGQFGQLFKELGLTPVQIEQLRELLILGEGVTIGSRDHPPMVISLSPDGVPANRDRMTVPPDRDQQIKEIIGEVGFQRFQDYNNLGLGRQFAQQLATSLYFTPTPLSAEQAGQMARIFAESPKESTSWGNRTDWETVLAKAATVLTEPQLAPLRGFRDQEEYNLAHNEATRRGSLPVRRQSAANAANK